MCVQPGCVDPDPMVDRFCAVFDSKILVVRAYRVYSLGLVWGLAAQTELFTAFFTWTMTPKALQRHSGELQVSSGQTDDFEKG